ncbi:DUF4160 domain-containing protein [Myxococcota bacterium]|nr:DUF4160 domain-containing protein [Myxococcota bacterium]
MPTIDRFGPYRFFIFANEGDEPRHVHARRDGALAKFWHDPVALCSSTGFSLRELRRLLTIVRNREAQYEEAWDEFFRR